MYWDILDVKYLENFKLLLVFRDNIKKVVDLESHLHGPIFEPLRDVEYFRNVKLNPEIDAIYWDNGADFAPEFLFDIGIDQK